MGFDSAPRVLFRSIGVNHRHTCMLACPSNSCTVRMSYPASSRCVANECRSVWQVTRLVNPAKNDARLTTRSSPAGCACHRDSRPVAGFARFTAEGNRNCHPNSRAPAASCAAPNQERRHQSPRCWACLLSHRCLTRSACRRSPTAADAGNGTARSFCPFPARTKIV